MADILQPSGVMHRVRHIHIRPPPKEQLDLRNIQRLTRFQQLLVILLTRGTSGGGVSHGGGGGDHRAGHSGGGGGDRDLGIRVQVHIHQATSGTSAVPGDSKFSVPSPGATLRADLRAGYV
jgi:hypothetical protein